MATHNKPFHTLRSSGMKAAIWLNDGIKGPFFSTTFSRSFKDRAGAWRNASSFSFSDLEAHLGVRKLTRQFSEHDEPIHLGHVNIGDDQVRRLSRYWFSP